MADEMVLNSLERVFPNLAGDYLQRKCAVAIILVSESMEIVNSNDVLLKLLGLSNRAKIT